MPYAESPRLPRAGARSLGSSCRRPWYRDAKKKPPLAITDPYVFASSHELGITLSSPLRDGIGVAGADIHLGALQHFPKILLEIGIINVRVGVEEGGHFWGSVFSVPYSVATNCTATFANKS